MNIILLTQDDPFYLPESIRDFIKELTEHGKHTIVQAIVTPPSPFGKRESFLKKLKKTYDVFGVKFFIFYALSFMKKKIILRESVIKEINHFGIPVWQLKNSINNELNLARLKKISADIIVIIAGNQIIKKQALESTKYGVINAHSSLLPEYKGLMPTFWVLKNMEKETGVSVYYLTEGIDNGPIILQRKISIGEETTQAILVKECKVLATKLIIESLDMIENNQVTLLNNMGGSYYKFPTREDVNVFLSNGKNFF